MQKAGNKPSLRFSIVLYKSACKMLDSPLWYTQALIVEPRKMLCYKLPKQNPNNSAFTTFGVDLAVPQPGTKFDVTSIINLR
jgi:hypothetical protein